MKLSRSVDADIYQAVIEASPAHRATLNHRRRKVAEHRLEHHHGLSWGITETLDCVPDKAFACMGGLLLFLIFQFVLHKWRKRKGSYPIASRYASRCTAAYVKFAKKVHNVYRRKKRAIDRKVFRIRLWCIVSYYLLYGKLYRQKVRCKKKLIQVIERIKILYMKATISIYCRLPSLRVSAAVLFLWLFMSGDVELNPGPKEGEDVCKHDILCNHCVNKYI